MSNNSKKKWAVGFIAALFLFYGVYYVFQVYINSLPAKYTIGQVTKSYKARGSGYRAVFEYYIEDKSYTNSIPLTDLDISRLERAVCFFVKVPEGFNSFGRILLEHPVKGECENIGELWDEIPKQF